ncbi:MAG: ATP-binding protein [Oceanipulchritudo sp.]
MSTSSKLPHEQAALRRRAEKRLRAVAPAPPQGDPRRLMHELQVHQIELEMQNEELRDARTRLEMLVEKFTDLYDFAPVGYFSLDASSRIHQANLTAAAMLGIERSRLLRRLFSGFVAPSNRPVLSDFLRGVFEGGDRKVCELALDKGADSTVWVDLQGTLCVQPDVPEPLCRLAVSDITALKRAAEAQSRVEALKAINNALEAEILRRKEVEEDLRKSRKRQSSLLAKALQMQEQLRLLSHQFLHIQEEERKRISLDLHDEVAQTLVAINLHLASLARDSAANDSHHMRERIVITQKLVEQSVERVHQFAKDLRPTVLDDLGLIPALRTCLKDFSGQTGIPFQLATPGDLKPLDSTPATVLYRVAQAALSNVAEHAEATEVRLAIRQTRRLLHMEVRDNGKGFNPKCRNSGMKANRLGLIGMRERMEMVGGKLRVSSAPGTGTTVHASLPVQSASPASS